MPEPSKNAPSRSGAMSFYVGILLAGLVGFLAGQLPSRVGEVPELTPIEPEITVTRLERFEGDQMVVKIHGPGRITWAGGEQSVDGAGEHRIPLGQILTEEDLRLTEFPYVGNAKTNKFYPADSYSARGTEVQHRRFFESKEAAVAEGFEPSKAVE